MNSVDSVSLLAMGMAIGFLLASLTPFADPPYLLRPVDAADLTYQTVGSITEGSCFEVGGTVKTNILDAQHSQWTAVCKVGESYYEIVSLEDPLLEPSACATVVVQARDPDTGRVYTFPTPCEVPQGCDNTHSWGTPLGFQASKLYLSAGRSSDHYYNITVAANNVLCTFKQFNGSEKTITIVAIGARAAGESEGHMDVQIPANVLAGGYKVLVDGNSSNNFHQTAYGVSGQLQFSHPYERRIVEIIGTAAIPEFAIWSSLLTAIALAVTIIVIPLCTRFLPQRVSHH